VNRRLVVVQNNFVERLTAPMADAVHERGMTLHDVSSGDMAGVRPVPEGGTWGPILIIGSILFTNQWARGNPELGRWIFWDDAMYDAALWSESLGELYLNHDGHACTVGSFIDSRPGLRHIRPRSGVKMVGIEKPTESKTGFKSVAGIVVDADGLADLGVDGRIAIWASPAKTIDAEVRVWMVGGRPACASTYRIGGRHHADAEHPHVESAIAAAVHACSIWNPGRHHVVDMAMVDGRWLVVEFNPIHSSGWYGADPGDLLDAYMECEDRRFGEGVPTCN
jgi:hypothetical protein